MDNNINWVPEYIREAVKRELLEGEHIVDVGKYDNGYGEEYIAVYTNQSCFLFDLYTHNFLRSEPM